MRILVVNTGSSSVKLSVIGEEDETLAEQALGAVTDATTQRELAGFLDAHAQVDACGHRIVQGGPDLLAPAIVDAAVRRRLDAGAAMAPLHVPPALHMLDVVAARLDVPQVVCIDTAFHAALPEAARTYAIPIEWREGLGVRRYGFHGLSCAWSLRRAAELLREPASALQLLVAHLGAGASVTAIRHGTSVDTTMGFTPLEGLVMATRSGTVDPGALLWLQTAHGVTDAALVDALEHRSGLMAIAGTGDAREMLRRAASGDASAALARDVYVHRARALVAAMAVSLDRIDALVFTGGIGEHAEEIRDAICAGLGAIGIEPPRLARPDGEDGAVSASDARVPVLVIHAREDLQIAREVRALVSAGS